MISDSFDMESEAIITPSSFFGEKGKICDIAIATFSREIFPAVLKLFENEKIGEMKAANRIKPVYLLDVNNLKIAFYLSEIGASLSGTDIIEVNWMTGAKKFILFGSAGSLDKETTKGKYVIPYEACGDYCVDTKEKLVEILYFRHFAKHFTFTSEGKNSRNKHLKNYFDVSVVIDIGCGNTNEK